MVTIADDFPLQATRQVNLPYERITWVYGALAVVAVALRPTCIITVITYVLV